MEYSEYVLFDAATQLAQMCSDAEAMPAPQMWIGSSVALAVDAGKLPSRQEMLNKLATRAQPEITRVQVFDWGRSELNRVEQHEALSEKDQEFRAVYWNLWLRAAVRILYEATASAVKVEVYDWDTMEDNDFIGSATSKLEVTSEPQVLTLLDENGQEMETEVMIEISTTPVTTINSRLAQIWHVHVHSASDLPRMDAFSKSDGYVRVSVETPGIACGPYAQTGVIWDDDNPEFDARLDFGVARQEVVEDFYRRLSAAIGEQVRPELVCRAEADEEHTDIGFKNFVRNLSRFQDLAGKELSVDTVNQTAKSSSFSSSRGWSFCSRSSNARSVFARE